MKQFRVACTLLFIKQLELTQDDSLDNGEIIPLVLCPALFLRGGWKNRCKTSIHPLPCPSLSADAQCSLPSLLPLHPPLHSRTHPQELRQQSSVFPITDAFKEMRKAGPAEEHSMLWGGPPGCHWHRKHTVTEDREEDAWGETLPARMLSCYPPSIPPPQLSPLLLSKIQ